jgi:hypothetical protein
MSDEDYDSHLRCTLLGLPSKKKQSESFFLGALTIWENIEAFYPRDLRRSKDAVLCIPAE